MSKLLEFNFTNVAHATVPSAALQISEGPDCTYKFLYSTATDPLKRFTRKDLPNDYVAFFKLGPTQDHRDSIAKNFSQSSEHFPESFFSPNFLDRHSRYGTLLIHSGLRNVLECYRQSVKDDDIEISLVNVNGAYPLEINYVIGVRPSKVKILSPHLGVVKSRPLALWNKNGELIPSAAPTSGADVSFNEDFSITGFFESKQCLASGKWMTISIAFFRPDETVQHLLIPWSRCGIRAITRIEKVLGKFDYMFDGNILPRTRDQGLCKLMFDLLAMCFPAQDNVPERICLPPDIEPLIEEVWTTVQLRRVLLAFLREKKDETDVKILRGLHRHLPDLKTTEKKLKHVRARLEAILTFPVDDEFSEVVQPDATSLGLAVEAHPINVTGTDAGIVQGLDALSISAPKST